MSRALAETEAAESAARTPSPRTQMVLEETLLPTPNSVDLVRTSQSDYRLRFMQKAPHVAELFQENTKLTPYSALPTPESDAELADAKAWFFASSYRMKEADIRPAHARKVFLRHSDLPEPLARLLGPFAKDGPLAGLPYSVDVWLLFGARLLRVVCQSDILWVERQLGSDEVAGLRQALLAQPAEVIARTRAFLLVVAAPWRYMMFKGPRGYRHMMFEAGSLISQLHFIASQLRLGPVVCPDFYDAQVDRMLLLDGVERTTLSVIALPGAPGDGL